jgi:sulfite reductase (NADPH) flavoprotein alpha-component
MLNTLTTPASPPTSILPDDAPFSSEQREWLNGFLSGLLSQYDPGNETAAPSIPVTILWGSQTGTSEGLAKKFAKLGRKSGLDPKVVDASDYPFAQLVDEQHLLIITSTYGDGEAPDNMASFYNELHADDAPELKNLNYSILSIGDSSYPDFCQCGIDLDQQLQKLGATAIAPRVDCDLELDEDFAAWTENVMAALGQVTAEDEEEDTGHDKNNPFTSKILCNKNLNAEESDKATHHLEFCLKDSGLTYEAGDALGVYPANCPDLVDDILSLLPFDGSETTAVGNTLKEALISHYEIRNLTLPVLTAWAEASTAEPLARFIDDKSAASDFMWGRDIIDLLRDYPVSFANADDFLALLKKLTPRLYSISSSPKAHPDEVHLTVGLVRYQSNGFTRKGVCSSFLAERSDTTPPRVYMHSNKAFRPPADPTTPMIMVGPGTGIAPFRAFIEERAATKAPGKNWLFFGNPHIATDYLYQDELDGFQKNGYLHQLSTAFSRDQKDKIYVQDKIIEHAEELFSWLEAGAHFYVCGDASRMAKDVDAALHRVIETQGNMSTDAAAQYVQTMKSDKRYGRDVY